MSLITETNEKYYAGQHSFVGDDVTTEFPTTFNTPLSTDTVTQNFTVTVNGVAVTPVTSVTNPQTVVINPAPGNGFIIIIKLNSNNIIYAEPHPISNGRLMLSAAIVL